MYRSAIAFVFGLSMFCACSLPAFGQENVENEAEDNRFLRTLEFLAGPVFTLNEFFETTLPGTVAPFDLTLDVRPRLGDFVRRRFIRIPMELRYGMTKRLEAFGVWSPVTPNPFRNGRDSKWSPGVGGLGFRYNLDARLHAIPMATFSVRAETPLGRPPVQLIDGYAHVEARLALMRPFFDDQIFPYLNLVHDRAYHPPGHSSPDPVTIPRQHISELIPGVIYKPNEFGYVIQYTFRIIDELTQTRHAHAYRTGVIWDVPMERSAKWKIPGKWQLEASYELTDEQQRDIDHAIILRARWRFNLSRDDADPSKTND